MRLQYFSTNFLGGMVSREISKRSDLDKYNNALLDCSGFYIKSTGGIYSDPGTMYIANSKSDDYPSRLIGHSIAIDENYLLEFFENGIRFFKEGVPITVAGVPYEVTTTYDRDEIQEIQVKGHNRNLYITHPDHIPKKLTRNTDTDWDFETCVFYNGPYDAQENKAVVANAKTGNDIHFTMAAPGLWESGHVQSLWRFKHDDDWGYGRMVSFENDRNAHFDIIQALKGTTIQVIREGCWSFVKGWPISREG